MAEAVPDVECGFCCSKSDRIVDPKVLPCSHVHCKDCLTTYYESSHSLLCGYEDCGQVFEVSPDSLPSYDLRSDKTLCDVCVKKGSNRQKAISYCTYCCKKFCPSHLRSHDDMLEEHHKITFFEFLAGEQKAKVSKCPDHKDQQYVLGCGACHVISCLKCVPALPLCDQGASHSLEPLEDLASKLLTGRISAESSAKDEEFKALFKRVSKLQAEYDTQTESMLEMIHQKRNAQMNSLREQYNELEKKVVENRQKSKQQITDFLEDVVLNNWRKLRNQREMMETKIKHSPPDDIVRGFNELKQQMDKFIVEELPRLEVGEQLQLKQRGEQREIELEIVSSSKILVDPAEETAPLQQQTLRALKIRSPKSLALLKSVEMPFYSVSVCQHEEVTYVGLDDGRVMQVDKNSSQYKLFTSDTGIAESVSVYKNQLYIVNKQKPLKIFVYDLSGQFITTWQHPYHRCCCDMLTVAAGHVVVADPPNKRVTVYSLTGETLRNISCSLLSNTIVTICSGYGDDVIIADFRTRKVFRFNITTGKVVWTFNHPNHPQGLVCYGDCVLVAAWHCNSICVLNYDTGKKVSEIEDAALGNGDIYSMSIDGETLVVPLHTNKQLLFYRLNDN